MAVSSSLSFLDGTCDFILLLLDAGVFKPAGTFEAVFAVELLTGCLLYFVMVPLDEFIVL